MRALVQCVRRVAPNAAIGRYSPDQLLLVLQGQDLAIGLDIAERVRHAARQSSFEAASGTATPVTVSGGLASGESGVSPELMLCYADTALCGARAAGDTVEAFAFGSQWPGSAA